MASRRDLVPGIAEALSVSKQEADRIFVAVLKALKYGLQKDRHFILVGFGTFLVKDVPAYSGRNPATGEKISIAASRRVLFRPGLELKNLVNDK